MTDFLNLTPIRSAPFFVRIRKFFSAGISAGIMVIGILSYGDMVSAAERTPAIPVLAPITGFLALEGTSQRNGAVLALESTEQTVTYESLDTHSTPTVATNAFIRIARTPGLVAVSAPMLGTQMLALLPLAQRYRVPLVTVSGTAAITERGNPWIFRFFPGDAVVKIAHARYAVEILGARRPALVYQTTAYGQSGHQHLSRILADLEAPLVFAEGVSTATKDMLPILSKALAADPDILLLHLHSGPTALIVRQARAMGITLPIVAGSALHQPSTAALLTPDELKDVCTETGSSPISGGSPAMVDFTDRYRARWKTEPDAFAVGQYDAVSMVLAALADGAKNADQVRDWLAGAAFDGLAMTYRSDGKGNMAHDALILCYDGESRVPRIMARYQAIDGVGERVGY